MNLQQLEYFVLLAKTEHMTKTAQQLNTSQPNLSYSMRELEKELGAPLLKKAGRNIQLTKYGKLFYQYAEKSLKELSNGITAIDIAMHPNYGEINFGFIYTMGSEIAPKSVQNFLAIEGNSEINFSFRQGNSHEIISLLLDESIDIGLCSHVDNHDKIEFVPFYKQEIILVVPEEHPLAMKESVSLKETISYPYIYFDKNSGLRPYLDNMFDSLSLSPEHRLFVEEDHSMLGFISAGFGIGFLPNIPSISSYPVKTIRLTDKFPPRYIYLATQKNALLSPAAQKFKDYLLNQ